MTTADTSTTSAATGTVDTPTPGSRLATGGLAVAAAGPLLIVVADPGATPFVLPFVLVPGIGALLAWRFGRWSKVLAAVLGGLLVFAMVGGPPGEGLRYPASFFDFVPSVMFLLGGLGALAGGLTAARPSRADASAVGRREPVIGRVGLGLVVLAAVVSATASLATGRSVDPAAAAGAVEVVLEDAEFVPESLSLPGGETTTLLLRNEGRVVHTFTSDALDVDETLLPGDEVLVEVAPTGTAPVAFWCKPHSDRGDDGERDGMAGTIELS